MAGKTLHPRQSPADFSKLALAPAPEAVIIGFADSRCRQKFSSIKVWAIYL